ncbi:hypothetical protein SVIO_098690 [Streptomyces violaceusniger]|uniref:Uncharacterized protein n=1 Tax=Streptomyces violaceusniger TaxID=68280 RepID=A0A4D4LIX0_STRVO|nr:hypothetical protein SVIO_098690 [Streptomyces violaceusniger]
MLRPAPLSLGATKEVILDQFGVSGDEEFARACHESSAGNPLFLKSVLVELAMRGHRPTAEHVETARSLRPAQLRERLASSLRAQTRPRATWPPPSRSSATRPNRSCWPGWPGWTRSASWPLCATSTSWDCSPPSRSRASSTGWCGTRSSPR